jgi:pimeloyl-ACP methyl ester carboxylesterase
MDAPAYWRDLPEVTHGLRVKHSTLRYSDGRQTWVHRYGVPTGGATIIIVNPIATPALLTSRIADALSRRVEVISPENRRSPYLEATSASKYRCGVDRFARDVYELVEWSGATDVHFVGWCSSAFVILSAIDQFGIPARSLTLIAPSAISGSADNGSFSRSFIPLIRRISTAPEENAKYLLNVLHKLTQTAILHTSDDRIVHHLVWLNIRSVQSVSDLADVMEDYEKDLQKRASADHGACSAASLFARIARTCPTLLIHCRDDQFVSYESSVNVVVQTNGVGLILYPFGGHFVPYKNHERVAADIGNFIASVNARSCVI